IARCWATVAEFFGVKPTHGANEVPPPPSDVERDFSGGAAEFWTMLTGPEVQLTPVEIGVVQGRLNDNAEKERQKKLGDGDSSTSDSVHVDMAEKGGGKEVGDASSPNTG
ncbi:unnamed protein product, partial [Ectocarpus sp. 8 AP-2014]